MSQADRLILRKEFDGARAILEAGIARMPPGWQPMEERDGFLSIYFWDEGEFLSFCAWPGKPDRSIAWVPGSFAAAWYDLALIASKQGRISDALAALDAGQYLEPDQPQFFIERGYLFGVQKRHAEAYENYVAATAVRPWMPTRQRACALRGQGVQLIDLGRLDDAEAALHQALECDAGSQLARNELEYIAHLRAARVPWFLRAYLEPPQDPLTAQWVLLAEGMPSIPGPETIGGDYFAVLDAFMKRGWPGFEEAFDRVVPRSRPDYADLKRDLLREPMFFPTVHRRMSEAATGIKTPEEIVAEIRADRKAKPD